MTNVRVGVIGPGAIANALHLPSMRAHPRAEVVAICGRNQENARDVARRFGIPKVHADHRQMLAQESLDAVLVLTPDYLHFPMTMDALGAGCHVLCDKPLAMSAREARAMLERATARSLIHVTFFNNRALPQMAYAKKLLEEGWIGRPLHCALSFTADWFLSDGRMSWKRDAGQSTGVLGGQGSHMIDLARWYMGGISRVWASLGTYKPPAAAEGAHVEITEDSAFLGLEFESGAHGSIQVGAVSAGSSDSKQIRIDGDEGALEIRQSYFSPITQIRGGKVGSALERMPVPVELCGGGTEPLTLDDFVRFYTTQPVGTRAFIDAILEGRQIAPSFADGLATQLIIDAARESARSGSRISLREDEGGRS